MLAEGVPGVAGAPSVVVGTDRTPQALAEREPPQRQGNRQGGSDGRLGGCRMTLMTPWVALRGGTSHREESKASR